MRDFDRYAGRRRRPRFDDDDWDLGGPAPDDLRSAPDDLWPAPDDRRSARDRPRPDTGERRPEPLESDDLDLPEIGDRWSTWDQSTAGERGPRPYPEWLVTGSAAVDTELGIVKTGKEADVFLVRREVPGTGPSCLLAAKRYRPAEHRLFHRDAGYLEGRRVKESRVNRAMARRTAFGREMISAQWAAAEFRALCQLWEVGRAHGVPLVPYPVQIVGTELLLEFIGTPDGHGAPRLAQLRPSRSELVGLWDQALAAMVLLSRCGLAHGDLSPYNILVREGRLVLIDLPQVLDVIANPNGPRFLARDARTVAAWFVARGLAELDVDGVVEEVLAEAGLRR